MVDKNFYFSQIFVFLFGTTPALLRIMQANQTRVFQDRSTRVWVVMKQIGVMWTMAGMYPTRQAAERAAKGIK